MRTTVFFTNNHFISWPIVINDPDLKWEWVIEVLLRTKKKSAKQKGQFWECCKMPEACAQNSPFVPWYCISFMQIYFWFYIVSPCVTPFGSGVVSTLWLSGSSLDEILLLSGRVSEVWLATVCPVQTCVPTLQHTKPCCPRENQFHNWAIVTTLTTW